MSSKSLMAGVGRRCINPPPNIAHGGWGAQKHEQAEGIDMDLWATALALSDGVKSVVVLDIDVQILTNERADGIREAVSKATGLPATNIRASATHTHSGPVPYKSWIEKGFEMVGPWFDQVYRLCAEAAQEAIAALEPVEMRAGRGRCGINANRRCITPEGQPFLGINLEKHSDHEVLVVRLDGKKESPVATLVNFACHPTIMGPPNRLITPDYPGAMKRVVESALGGKCLFLQGCAGNQGPMRGFIKDTTIYRSFGAILGHEVARVALELRAVAARPAFKEVIPSGAPLGIYESEFPPMTSLPLQVMSTEIMVPLRDGLPERRPAEERLHFWKERLKAAREKNDEVAITEAIYMARRADIQLRMADDFGGKTSTGVRVHFVTFDDVALVGCNIEPFAEIGSAIKAASPFPFTSVCGYTNGRLAYMPTAEEWPQGGYEVDNSPFGQDAAKILERGILDTLAQLRR